MKQLAVAILFLLWGSVPASSVCPPSKPIDELINQEMAHRRIPGLAFAVLKDGDIAMMGAYGTANLETDSPVRTTSVFELASLTKQFTATAVMLLVQEGKVGLDDPISALPEQKKKAKLKELYNRMLTEARSHGLNEEHILSFINKRKTS